MRGLVVFALMSAAMAVVDAAYFNGRYMSDLEQSISALASISLQMGHRQ